MNEDIIFNAVFLAVLSTLGLISCALIYKILIFIFGKTFTHLTIIVLIITIAVFYILFQKGVL
jgi:hypothetical protein